VKVPCSIIRGGTSKGIVVRTADLPDDAAARDRVILGIFGSPDRRQIDGLGGADTLTSKLALVAPPSRDDADIDYTYGQVLIDAPHVDYTGNCGNITAAVAAFAVDEGYATDAAPTEIRVRIHCTNSGRIVTAGVPLAGDGRRAEAGDLEIAGVPGTGAPILLDWADTAGAGTGSVLPMGPSATVPGFADIRFSVVDVGNPMLFVDRADFGVEPSAGPDEIDPDADLVERLIKFRHAAVEALGYRDPAGAISDSIPLLTLVGAPADYRHYGSGETVAAESMDVWMRSLFLGRVHKAFGVAEAASAAAAVVIPGTVAHELARPGALERGVVRIGHPSGVMDVEIEASDAGDAPVITRVATQRTARRIMDGDVWVAT